MSRYHWWGFIVNEAGEPIENAEITVYLAGTDILAKIYYDEFGEANSADTTALSGGPQLSTLSNGYYEFWVGDASEIYGYINSQKFKLSWMRIGVAYGEIDYINVFPLGPDVQQMSLTDCVAPSTVRNKLISDWFACKWDTHVDSTITDGGFSSIHGLDFITTDDQGVTIELDTVPNKIIDNYHAWRWDHHYLSTVQNFEPSAGTPHGMEEVNPLDGSSTIRNKLISNADFYTLTAGLSGLRYYVDQQDNILQYQIDNLSFDSATSKAGWWEIYGDEWILDANDIWYVDINHNLEIYYPFVQAYDKADNKVITTMDIEYISVNAIRISVQNENLPDPCNTNLIVRIGTGGVQRHPVLTP